MVLLLGLWSAVATAGGTYKGVPVDKLPELGFATPSFETATEGWTAQFPKGLARLYVAPSTAALDAWMADKQAFLAKRQPAPYPGLGVAAWGDGSGLLLVRQGNVGLLIETTAGAQGWAEVLLGALVPSDGAWAAKPSLRAMPSGQWVVSAPGERGLAYRGGVVDQGVAPGSPLTFTQPPERLIAWDAMKLEPR